MKLYLDNVESNLFAKERELDSAKSKITVLSKKNKDLEEERDSKDKRLLDLESEISILKSKFKTKMKTIDHDSNIIHHTQSGSSTANMLNSNIQKKHMHSSSLNFNEAKLEAFHNGHHIKTGDKAKINIINTINVSSTVPTNHTNHASNNANKKSKLVKNSVLNEWKTSSTGFLEKGEKSNEASSSNLEKIFKKTITHSGFMKEPSKKDFQTMVVNKEGFESISRSTSKGRVETSARISSQPKLTAVEKKKTHNVSNSMKLNKEYMTQGNQNISKMVHIQGSNKPGIIRVLSKNEHGTTHHTLRSQSQSQSISSDGKENNSIAGGGSNIASAGKKIVEGSDKSKFDSSKQIDLKTLGITTTEVKNQLIMRINQNKDKFKSIGTSRK